MNGEGDSTYGSRQWRVTLFNLNRLRQQPTDGVRVESPTTGHDIFNYRDPRINYNKLPRRITRSRLTALGQPARSQGQSRWRNLVQRVLASNFADGSGASGSRLAPAADLVPQSGADSVAELLGTIRVTNSMDTALKINSKTGYKRGDQQAVSSAPDIKVTCDVYDEKKSETAHRTAADLCRRFIESSQRYQLLESLGDIGSRSNKHWFLVRDLLVKTERILTITSVTHEATFLNRPDRVKAFHDLMVSMKHPYLLPVLDASLMELPIGYPVAVIVCPCSNSGSLRDILYEVQWQSEWRDKYSGANCGQRVALPVFQARRLLLQLLEAILYVRNRGILTPFTHLHSGNVIIQNGVARLSGVEACVLEYPGVQEWCDTDIHSVGALLYEMVAGRQMAPDETLAASLSHLEQDSAAQIRPLMEVIFKPPAGRALTLEALRSLDFFRGVHLRELSHRPPSLTEIRIISSESVKKDHANKSILK